ncbi:hypothetical protein [Desulfonauticus submarinus]
MSLWTKDVERKFFQDTLNITTPEKLFYITQDGNFVAYWPKGYKGKKETLQSRNAFIGNYTEKWTRELLEKIISPFNAFAVQGVVCEEIGLSKRSPADIAICKTKEVIQKAENILMLIEIKMSIVWNWKFDPQTRELKCIGDYTTHQGNPGLLRSDTMLKAIGKSINIRVSSLKSSHIPIIVLGNTPITRTYYEKVDFLKKTGIIQGFYSLNPSPLDNPKRPNNIKATPQKGFVRLDSFSELREEITSLLSTDREFFLGMKPKEELGRLIELANREPTYEKKAEKFLKLLRENG